MSMRWWAVYRGGEYIEHVLAASGERALDVVSERESIPLEELDAVDHGAMERSGLVMLPFYSQELGPEFSEPVPTMRAVRGRSIMAPDRLTLAEYARAMSASYSTLYDRVRAAERRGGHGIQTRDESGELKRQYRKDWRELCRPIPRGRPKKEVERD